jgi:hypothetical protein
MKKYPDHNTKNIPTEYTIKNVLLIMLLRIIY